MTKDSRHPGRRSYDPGMTSLRCPRCRTALASTTTDGARFERCSNCKGLAVAVGVLRRFAPSDRVRAIWVNLPASRPGADCPSCSRMMAETKVAAGDDHVELDVCKACQLLWFDADELARFSPQRQSPPPRERPFSPAAAEAVATADIAFRAQRQRELDDARAIGTALWLFGGTDFS